MENRIKQRILQSGITQKELAEKLGITTVGLSQIVNTAMPKIATCEKIAKVVGMPVWMLLLSDSEIDEIRTMDKNAQADDRFRCPVCGACLQVIPCVDE